MKYYTVQIILVLVGRVELKDNLTFYVYIDDNAIKVGTTNSLQGDVTRTWYDGISYAKVGTTNTVDVAEYNFIPRNFMLNQNYPKTFNPTTKISSNLSKPSYVTLKVYDLLGREIKTLVNQYQNAGNYEIISNAENLPSGIYFYQLIAGDKFSETKKMVLTK